MIAVPENDEMLQDVQSWLSQNGYVLEMEVAQAFLPSCSQVTQGRQYIDPVSNKLRETDVFCCWNVYGSSGPHVVEMAIECKSTTSPWIAFFGASKEANEMARYPSQITAKSPDCRECRELRSFYDIGPGKSTPIAYSITEKKSAKSDKDLARDAVLAVTSAAVGILREVENDQPGSTAHYSYRILPVVITKSPIVACSLAGDSEIGLSRINSCWISTFHETRDIGKPILGLVVNHASLGPFAAEVSGICERLGLN